MSSGSGIGRERNSRGGGGGGRVESNWSAMTGTFDPRAWYIDSGATAHMTNNVGLLSSIRNSMSMSVSVADGRKLPVKAEGKLKLTTRNADVTVHRVLLVPGKKYGV